MNILQKKLLLLLLFIFVNIVMLVACKSNDINNDKVYSVNIHKDNAKALSIKTYAAVTCAGVSCCCF